MDFGTVGDAALLELTPEESRHAIILTRQDDEKGLEIPKNIEIDIDVMKDFVDDGKGYDGIEGTSGFSLKSLLRRKGKHVDKFMVRRNSRNSTSLSCLSSRDRLCMVQSHSQTVKR